MLEKTDSEFVMVVALLTFQGQYLSDKQPPDLLVNVTATNDALQNTCLTLCYVRFYEAAKAPPTISHPFIKRLVLVKRIFHCCQLTEPCFGNTNYVRLVKKTFSYEVVKFGIQTPSIIIQGCFSAGEGLVQSLLGLPLKMRGFSCCIGCEW